MTTLTFTFSMSITGIVFAQIKKMTLHSSERPILAKKMNRTYENAVVRCAH